MDYEGATGRDRLIHCALHHWLVYTPSPQPACRGSTTACLMLVVLLQVFVFTLFPIQSRGLFRTFVAAYTIPLSCERNSEVCLSNVEHSGLRNLGQTCYLNSLIQALYAQKQFRKAILNVTFADETASQKLKNIFRSDISKSLCNFLAAHYLDWWKRENHI